MSDKDKKSQRKGWPGCGKPVVVERRDKMTVCCAKGKNHPGGCGA